MNSRRPKRAVAGRIAVAGHVCLDIIPELYASGTRIAPGKLVVVGPATVSTGGAVPNTGIALHRLGLPVTLLGKVGDDLFGRAVLARLRSHGRALADGMIVARGENTSYTVVLSPPGADRTFLHSPGANDTFRAADVPASRLAGAALLHFGYPPLMRRMRSDGGRELRELLGRARRAGLTTSLDMAMPDPRSEAGRLDWPRLLARVLPRVDFFLPSLEEIRFMLGDRSGRSADGALLGRLSGRLLGMGAAAVGIKLGADGLYLRTTADRSRLADCGRAAPDALRWAGRELLAPCFRVRVAGTTGSGDCTIAGFLAGLVKGLGPEETLTAAVATGACCVESADATGGIIPWTRLARRIRAGWPRLPVGLSLPGWKWQARRAVWTGPADRS